MATPDLVRPRTTLLLAAAAALLGLGLALPTVVFETALSPPEVYSIVGGVRSLWSDGNFVLAPLVFAFSVLLPTTKLVLLLRVRRRGRGRATVRFLRRIGRWSMLDVFVIALFVGGIRLGVASASSRAGIHVFALAIFVSMLAAMALERDLARGPEAAPEPAAAPARSSIGRLLSLASVVLLGLALTRPVLELRRAVVFQNTLELGPTTQTLGAEGEPALAVYLALFVLGASSLRALLSLAVRFLPRVSTGCTTLLRHADEWAMLEVFALALLIVRIKFAELTETTLLPGFWLVLAAGACALLDARERQKRRV